MLVTPGPWGFIAIAGIAIAAILLILDMVRRTRRLRYRVEIREKLEAERAAAAGEGVDPDRADGHDHGLLGDDDPRRAHE
ncbi:hypothetical protein GCM10027515_27820 [Schumannella luteola]|uniref:Uncharacterized protein n=1 Tax=Schumannella luteola TaxID=472059 RepID=A0A852YDN4_9MICO|nr:hypothetical protein [Schumannella luteola]